MRTKSDISLYYAMAYRWGKWNGHQYFVLASPDKRRASWPMPEWLWELCEALDNDGGL